MSANISISVILLIISIVSLLDKCIQANKDPVSIDLSMQILSESGDTETSLCTEGLAPIFRWTDPPNSCWCFNTSKVIKCNESEPLNLATEQVRQGDMGQPVVHKNLSTEGEKLIEDIRNFYGYNEYISESIGFYRRLPDYRHKWYANF